MSIWSTKRLKGPEVLPLLIQLQPLHPISNWFNQPRFFLKHLTKGEGQINPTILEGATKILSVTYAHGRALCLFVGEEATDSSICKA